MSDRLGRLRALDHQIAPQLAGAVTGERITPTSIRFLAGAGGSDTGIGELYRDQQQARYKGQQHLARSLARQGVLKEGLSETRATDIMWAIANPNTHNALVGQRHWRPRHLLLHLEAEPAGGRLLCSG